MHFSRVPWFAVLVIGLSVAGCTGGAVGSGDRQPVFKVKGKITMAGGAVPNAFVSFSPKGKQPVATGRTGTDGTYTLTTYDGGDGAAAGDYVVLVTKVSASPPTTTLGGHDPKNIPSGASMHAAQNAAAAAGDAGSTLPEKYGRREQSDPNTTVKSSNDNVLDFDLKP
jgi:hypothetical protein